MMAATPTEAMRDEFEAFFRDSRSGKGANKPDLTRLRDGDYYDSSTQRHWWTWQQSCAATLRSQPPQVPSEWLERAMELADAFGRLNDPERREALRTHLSARLLPPQGWQMVPTSPTAEMVDAGLAEHDGSAAPEDELANQYRAMCAAAPKE
jgi:hypothetical protein